MALLEKLDRFPVEQLGNDLRDTVQGAKNVTTSPELLETVRALNEAVVELKRLIAGLRTTVAPGLSATLDRIWRVIRHVGGDHGSDSEVQGNVRETLNELAGAARALRFLADYLGAASGGPDSLEREGTMKRSLVLAMAMRAICSHGPWAWRMRRGHASGQVLHPECPEPDRSPDRNRTGLDAVGRGGRDSRHPRPTTNRDADG